MPGIVAISNVHCGRGSKIYSHLFVKYCVVTLSRRDKTVCNAVIIGTEYHAVVAAHRECQLVAVVAGFGANPHRSVVSLVNFLTFGFLYLGAASPYLTITER